MGNRNRKKLSVTLDPEVVAAVRQAVKEGPGRTTSGVVEEALRLWCRLRRRRRLDQEVEKYYLSLSPAERAEDEEWAHLACSEAAELWRDDA